MPEDATVSIPEPSSDLKALVYGLRGEVVSVAGHLEWILSGLALEFTSTEDTRVARQWDAIKSHLRSQDLTDGLQTELAAVAKYFDPRNRSAHAAAIFGSTGGSAQIFLLYRAKGESKVALVTIEDLEYDLAVMRHAHSAVQRLARALDDHDPAVLATMDPIPKAILLGRS